MHHGDALPRIRDPPGLIYEPSNTTSAMLTMVSRIPAGQLSEGQLSIRLSEYQRVLRMLEGYTSPAVHDLRRRLSETMKELEQECSLRCR